MRKDMLELKHYHNDVQLSVHDIQDNSMNCTDAVTRYDFMNSGIIMIKLTRTSFFRKSDCFIAFLCALIISVELNLYYDL